MRCREFYVSRFLLPCATAFVFRLKGDEVVSSRFVYVRIADLFFFPRLQAAEDDQRQHSEDMSKMEESLIMKDEIIRYNSTEIVLRKDIAHCSRETQSLILLLICRMSKKPANLKRSL